MMEYEEDFLGEWLRSMEWFFGLAFAGARFNASYFFSLGWRTDLNDIEEE